MTIIEAFPTGFASLSDGSTTIPFIFTDGQGKKDPLSFRSDPYPRTALKTISGESKYSDLEPPFFAIPQDDFTGGRGNEDFESDTSRYFDGHWIDTTKEDGIVLGGRESYGIGYHDTDLQMPGSMSFQGSYSTTRYLAVTFEASASYTTYQCEIWVKKIGSPGDLQVELWSESGSEPNAMLCTKTLTASNITTDVLSVLMNFIWTGAGSNEDITDGSDYWVSIDGGSGATSTNHWAIGVDANSGGKRSSDSSSWTTTEYSPYFRITSSTLNPANTPWDYVTFFEYKRGLYMFTRDDNVDSKLYINGDRGTCDANTGALSTLVDGTKSWATNEWAGCYVILLHPLGTQEGITWRLISSNTSTALTITPDWTLVHTTADDYVIVGSDKWTLLRTLAKIRNFTVGSDHVYFSTQDNSGMVRYRAYNSGSSWAEEEVNISNDSDHLQYVKPPGDTHGYLHCVKAPASASVFNRQQYYFKSQIPIEPSGSYFLEQAVAPLGSHKKYWDGKLGANLTIRPGETAAGFTIASGHTTGIIAVQNFDTPLDLTRGRKVSFDAESDVNCDSGDFQFCFSDVEGLEQTWSPVKVFKADYGYNKQPTKVLYNTAFAAANTYADKTTWYDGKETEPTAATVTWANADLIFIGYSEPFNKITWALGTTKNAEVQTTAASYFNGDQFTAVSGFNDGTLSGGATLAQDGAMSWTTPEDWQKCTINSTEAYWIYLNATADLTADMEINNIHITIDEAATMAEVYDDLTNTYDGMAATDDNLTLGTEDYIWIGYGTKFNKITVDIGTANDIASVMTAKYFNGSAMTAVTISDGTDSSGDTLKQDGDITFTIPNDWEANTVNGTETYWIRLDVSVALVTAFSINEITVTFDAYHTVNFIAMTANVWEHYSPVINRHLTNIDWTSIKSIGINLVNDKGANVLDIKNFQICDNGNEDKRLLPTRYPTKGIVEYAGNVDDPVNNPWIITEAGVFEIQTQNDDQIVPLPLEEIGVFKSEDTGFAATVNGTYLYFNLGKRLERYFNRTLDDIGPDRDAGLPANRQGFPSTLVSYPGRVFCGIDAQTGYSSVLVLKGSSWHEVYRAPRTGMRIRDAIIHTIPDTDVHHLWVSMGNDVVKVPVNLNPYYESDFTFTHEGHVITSYIYANLLDVQKTWKSLKIFAENVTSTRNIVVDYQTDGSSTWTVIGTFDTVPVEEIDIASTLPQSKRIRYRLRFFTADQSETPRMKAIVTEGVAFVPVKTKYSWSFVISKDSQNIDLKGKWDSDLTSLQKRDQLLTWANAGTPLTMRHYSKVYDNKTVWVDPASVAPLKVVPNQDIENHVTQLSCFDY